MWRPWLRGSAKWRGRLPPILDSRGAFRQLFIHLLVWVRQSTLVVRLLL
ncbi:MAG: hypothetical protein ACTS6G_02930 [Candidatus Hodgkinia cicadicola]